MFIHREAARHLVLYAVDPCRQLSRLGRNRTVPRAALTTAQAATVWAWERKVRYPCISTPQLAFAAPTAPSIHMKRSARW